MIGVLGQISQNYDGLWVASPSLMQQIHMCVYAIICWNGETIMNIER